MKTEQQHTTTVHNDPGADTMITDPICGMTTADPAEYKKYVYQDRTYYFCSDHCLTKFKSDPQKYIQPDTQE